MCKVVCRTHPVHTVCARVHPTGHTCLPPDLTKDVGRQFLRWLRENTDTFDPVLVGIQLEDDRPLMDDEMIELTVQDLV